VQIRDRSPRSAAAVSLRLKSGCGLPATMCSPTASSTLMGSVANGATTGSTGSFRIMEHSFGCD
jgi:hypothetical protein